jgi:adenylosuccinate synthase
MQRGKFNVVIDGQWGSCGKGLIAGYLAEKYGAEVASTNNLPNAGHTVVWPDGRKFISKVLPISGATSGAGPDVLLGPGAGFFIDRLMEEIEETRISPKKVFIHPRAMVVTKQHAETEAGNQANSTKHIASTMQGSGIVQAERLMRGASVKLARDFPELQQFIVDDWIGQITNYLDRGAMWLHEGSQGFSLGMLHGSHYPQCTSRECTTAREMTDMGVPPQSVGDVYLVIRPYPIRVGNVIENGVQLGYSGDCYEDHHEISWADVHKSAGYPDSHQLSELTTVTKRVRRVFTFSKKQIWQAARVNGATKIVLNFANYLDYKCYGTRGTVRSMLPYKVQDFMGMLEELLNLPVALVGTGPQLDHVWETA